MKKTTYALKTIVIALALLFIMALVIGITSAAYNTSRTADGSLSMANGIVIDYSGFGKAQDGEWEKEQTTTFKLFANRDILPGDTINLNSAAIKKGTNSIDFYARIKFEYKFYDALDADITATVGNEYTNFISTPAFNSAWVNGNNNDGWFYYATGTTLNTLPASYVNIFSSSAINVELNVAGFNHEGGGYKFTDTNSNEITIAKVEAILTLEAVQTTGSTWEIIPAYTDAAGVVYTQNANETWTLTDGTALSNNSSSSTAIYSARIYTSSYSYTVLSTINNQDVVAIGDEAFLNASQLTAVTIPTTVTTIGSRAFEGTGLTAVTLPESVEEVGTDALASNSITEVTIENDQAVITGIATAGIPTASTINVPSVVFSGYETTLGSGYTGLTQAAAPLVASVGLAYSYDSSTSSYTVTGIGTCTDTAIVIPSTYDDGTNGEHNVTSIGDQAFYNCSGLTSVTVPNSVASIGGYAFGSCTGLISVSVGSGVTSIGDYAFVSCTGLANATIPSSVRVIGERAFNGCSSLSTVTIPNSVTSIGDYAFNGCSGLTEINYNANILTDFEDGVLVFGGAGQDVNGITLTIGNGVAHVPGNLFSGCRKITSVTIPSSVTSIGVSAFRFCGFTTITIPSSVTSIGVRAFKGCSGLSTVTIPNGVTSIGDYAFSGCTGLTAVTIPSSVTSIGYDAFAECSGLTEINYNANISSELESNSSIFSQLGSDGAGITLIIGNSVTRIPTYLFSAIYRLSSVTIPSSVQSIGERAFYSCYGLTSVNISSGVTSIGDYAFSNCTGLTAITIPSSVTSIGDYAFSGCTGLTAITIPSSVTSVGLHAFSLCDNLNTVTIDSETFAGVADWTYSLLRNVTTLYVLEGLTVGSYITNNFTAQQTSDKAGYVRYVMSA